MFPDNLAHDPTFVHEGRITPKGLAELRSRLPHFDFTTYEKDPQLTKLGQIFTNLISNAVKFTPRSGSVIVEVVEQDNSGVMISVRDTGIGMTEDEIKVALEPFGHRVSGATAVQGRAGLCGVLLFALLISAIGGRAVPAFTHHWLERRTVPTRFRDGRWLGLLRRPAQPVPAQRGLGAVGSRR